jgi:hypothetical protein
MQYSKHWCSSICTTNVIKKHKKTRPTQNSLNCYVALFSWTSNLMWLNWTLRCIFYFNACVPCVLTCTTFLIFSHSGLLTFHLATNIFRVKKMIYIFILLFNYGNWNVSSVSHDDVHPRSGTRSDLIWYHHKVRLCKALSNALGKTLSFAVSTASFSWSLIFLFPCFKYLSLHKVNINV